jgi:hypothetical protein
MPLLRIRKRSKIPAPGGGYMIYSPGKSQVELSEHADALIATGCAEEITEGGAVVPPAPRKKTKKSTKKTSKKQEG